MTAFDIYHSEFNGVFRNSDVKLFSKKACDIDRYDRRHKARTQFALIVTPCCLSAKLL